MAASGTVLSVNIIRPKEADSSHDARRCATKLNAACRNRHGHRDATAILIAYRHGLRASELVALRWDDIDFQTGKLHVRRAGRDFGFQVARRLKPPQMAASSFCFPCEKGAYREAPLLDRRTSFGGSCQSVPSLLRDQEIPTPVLLENQAMRRSCWPPSLGNPR
jgi:hypothetical protein